ncbi:MAG: hypothetical protein DWQ49_10990 [Bacteroidetes bacterium]|nr:MAG: hypothetical protein DWQ49_10990 [Bacteroidota bacterium]
MTSRTVIGTDTAVANPNIGTQTFMGATVVDFSCNSSWDSQGATCTVNLIEDSGQRVDTDSVVGQPRYFEIVDTGNNLVFSFNGILKNINRSVSPNGERRYSATLQSPTVLLQATSVITDHYIGAGDALEAVAPNTATSLEFGHINSSVTPANVYNLLNPFGVFENDDYGLSTPKGFGAAQVNEEGIRIDRFVAAIDALINGSNIANPELGRPILYGADKWGGAVGTYYYTFDIYSFVNSIISYIPNDYRVKSTTLMDFVAELCDEINFVYMVDLKRPTLSTASGLDGKVADSQLSFGVATDNAPEGVGTFGGEIFIITQNRNVYGATKFPLSYQLVRREVSDKSTGGALTSFSTGFGVGFGGNDLPLDFAWAGYDSHPGGPPNATSPFGGQYPYEDIDQDNIERYTSTSLDVSLNESAVGGKVVVGGFQSRIGFVPFSNNVYQYWGDIKRLDNFGSNASASDIAQRGIPVVTDVLDGNDIRDIILIDVQDLLGSTSITGAVRRGVYACSMLEMRYAMTEFNDWMFFMTSTKPGKLSSLNGYFTGSLKEIRDRIAHPNGTLTYAGKAYFNNALTTIASFNSSSNNVDTTNINCSDPISAVANMSYQQFLQKLHEKIKSLGDEHYGKSWLVKQPAFTTKLDEDEETVIANFIRSWDLSDDAYLEPTNFASYEAPQSPFFVSNGRLKSYVNYDAKFTNSTIYGGATVNYDFREYANSKFAQTQIGSDYIFSFLLDVEKDYIFLPSSYFTYYDESLFSSIVSGGVITSMSAAVTVDASKMNTAVDFLTGNGAKFYTKGGTDFFNISDHGIGMLPFALCKTSRVFLPLNAPATAGKSDKTVFSMMSVLGASCNNALSGQNNISGSQQFQPKPFPITVAPRSFGIPQQSNRFVYGPWITNSIKLDYATRVEYEQDDNLVPENYIIPSTVTIGGTTYTLTSGLGGLNTVGQAKANTIDNFDYLFTEQGSVTQPGLPAVTNLAVSLLSNGPLVSDISVNISATDITTNYSMKTFAPKLGRTNKRIIDQLGKLGKRINSIANLVR